MEDEPRRNRSNYSVHQREAGLNAMDRLLQKHARLGVAVNMMILCAEEDHISNAALLPNDGDEEVREEETYMLQALTAALAAYIKQSAVFTRLPTRRLPRLDIIIDSLDDVELVTRTGFTRPQLHRI